MTLPIFDATCAAHNLWPVERHPGQARTLTLTHLCDVCGMPYDTKCAGDLHDVADLLRRAFATTPEDWCEFCDEPMPRTGECPCWSAL